MSLENENYLGLPEKSENKVNGPYLGDNFPTFFCKKVERVVAAIFLVTGFLDERDGIKDNLRHSALNLLDASLHLATPPSPGGDTFASLQSSVEFLLRKIHSLLEVSLVNGLISRMNFDIMRSEVHLLLEGIVGADQRTFAPIVRVPSGLFSVPTKTGLSLNSTHVLKDTGATSSHQNTPATLLSVQSELRDKLLKEKLGAGNKGFISSSKLLIKEKKTNRRNIIINLIRKNQSITIKDISDVINDCSEKTLQRELARLVAEGVLKREGKRRWSRYSLL